MPASRPNSADEAGERLLSQSSHAEDVPLNSYNHRKWKLFGQAEGAWNEKPKKSGHRRLFRSCLILGFGGIGAFLLLHIISIFLGLTSLVWADTIQRSLTAWSQPGNLGADLSRWPTDFTRDIVPISCHSHNDYWRLVPLYSALHAGCISVEADVWKLPNREELLVGHSRASLTRNRTFTALYIDPLVEILERQNPSTEFTEHDGRTRNGVFDTDPEQSLVLLVDLKTDGHKTWPHVVRQLEPLRRRGWLTLFNGTAVIPGPITVVGTGNTPFDLLVANTTYRDYFFDAPLSEMSDENPPSSSSASLNHPQKSKYNPQNSHYASTAISPFLSRPFLGHITPAQIAVLAAQIRGAHARGLTVRYWDLPSWPRGWRNRVWDRILELGVDVLNVDDLEGVLGVW
ncbi:MAG: Altered inheritance of mitochondria protein 6 [Caeruleum heppii]|nr:MAG: Altered inheritance of mitochondria protein 6 [Caeruleum heppii]